MNEPCADRLNEIHIGVLAALPAELGPFLAASPESGSPAPLGVEMLEVQVPGRAGRVTAAVAGVGKVAAAQAALALIAHGAEGLFVVGTCGGLVPRERVGDLVHIERAIQWDLSVRAGRESWAHVPWLQRWREVAEGRLGVALTADRPALRWSDRYLRARALSRSGLLSRPAGEGDALVAVAEMETGAVGAVAAQAGIPWAGLRVVSDRQRTLLERATGRHRAASSFQVHFETQAPRPAESLMALLGACCA